MKTKKYLEFNGKNIFFISKDGQYWIAVKPICEALNVNYNRQFQNIKNDKILGSAFAILQMQVGNDQNRNWLCLPEFYIYGWLFQIKSSSEALKKYKWKVYEILYNYFKGSVIQRENLLKIKTKTEIEIEKLETELLRNEKYLRLLKLKNKKKNTNISLQNLDKKILDNQLEIWT